MLIGELSRLTGASHRSLRYYEAQGLLTARRGVNGYREYDEGAVATVRQIRALLEIGLSTDVIRTVLPCVRGELRDPSHLTWCDDLRAVLTRELASMDDRITGLQRSRRALASYLTES
ncbi:MerR family transcriptional regulator [Streptomyces sp. 8K308]|uniref:MerR family transcriptional regulator n=1 Tax=Streptomyces sp. 8K308 TaxID=2530388 RepID=UPI001051C591|nr:MerR family transcriptional regulator [Streptomyces sp. 8K308]TDC26033.1 MerR family transcriptional regulator [Streptomyces sp. 8K308]